jgi:hypothetical protein
VGMALERDVNAVMHLGLVSDFESRLGACVCTAGRAPGECSARAR